MSAPVRVVPYPELFEVLVDQCLFARQIGHSERARALARSAEGLLCLALPDIADLIGQAASRKGRGAQVADQMMPHLTSITAAVVAVVLALRSARTPVIEGIERVFGGDVVFKATVRKLCWRAFQLCR